MGRDRAKHELPAASPVAKAYAGFEPFAPWEGRPEEASSSHVEASPVRDPQPGGDLAEGGAVTASTGQEEASEGKSDGPAASPPPAGEHRGFLVHRLPPSTAEEERAERDPPRRWRPRGARNGRGSPLRSRCRFR